MRSSLHNVRASGLGGYAGAVALVGLANLAAFLAGAAFQGGSLVMLFLLSVLAAGAAFGLGPALAAALLASVTYNFFHLEPRYTFLIARPADLFTFGVFFAVALATGWLSGRVRDQARSAMRRAGTITTLLDASQALSATTTADDAAQALASQIGAATGGVAIVLLPADGGLRVAGAPRDLAELSAPGAEAAHRAWDAGAAEDVGWDFEALDGLHGRVGVVGFRRPRPAADEQGLLAALLRQGAVALERAALASAAAENQALRDADRLRSALLNSISHDFRTPLSTVLGSATTLIDYEADLTPPVRRDLLLSIREDAQRLNRYVSALLDMARLEAGALRPNADWVDVREVVDSALIRVRERLGKRTVRKAFAEPLPLVRSDATLLEQAVLNLLENAITHTPVDSGLEIAVSEEAQSVLISVGDEGPGVPMENQAQVFDKFRRAEGMSDRTGGLGLGLSITKGFVEALGGHVGLVSPVAEGRGSRFVIALPIADEAPREAL